MPFNFKKNPFIIVVYHYVRDVLNTEFPGIKACSTEKFRQQLEFLLKSYTITTIPELYKKAQCKSKDNRNYCALTFDDGLMDHYQNVLPLLKKYSITGTFFPITMTFEQKIPATHKIHVLLSERHASDIVRMLEKFMQREHPLIAEKYRIPRKKRLRPATRKFDDLLTANLKDTLVALPPEIKNCFLEECFKLFSLREGDICKKFFMSKDQIRKLKAEGMTIGSHTHRHFALDELDYSRQMTEINTSKNILEDFLDTKICLFSYPHGRFQNYTLDILKNLGFEFAVILKGRGVKQNNDCFTLPRYDTNDLLI